MTEPTTLREHAYRILNVFTDGDARLSGNPLCVFEDGRPFSDTAMQAIARQFNLSETTFILPASTAEATARVRIFTPAFEMPFAGHPTLGTALVVRDLLDAAESLRLEMIAGIVAVTADGERFTLTTARDPETRAPAATRAELADTLGVTPSGIAADPLWVDTGAEQLVVPLVSPEEVERAAPQAALLARHAHSDKRGASMAYVWARDAEPDTITARFFFLSGTSVLEDPATGSACANLGGYLVATGAPLPQRLVIRQGQRTGRPSRLHLEVDASRRVHVTGRVVELGRGTIRL